MNIKQGIELYLHPLDSGENKSLIKQYKMILKSAKRLYIVSAYLTHWNSKELQFNDDYDDFNFIIGQDFGITRKSACSSVLNSLPPKLKNKFYVVKPNNVTSFHPKAIFLETKNNKYFALIGSSNLTKAAFESNHEINIYTEISKEQFKNFRNWLNIVKDDCENVTNEWIDNYNERVRVNLLNLVDSRNKNDIKEILNERKIVLANFEKVKGNIINLFESCYKKQISSEEFYVELKEYWNFERKNRLQTYGWERTGKHSDFQKLAASFVEINKKVKQYEKNECDLNSLDTVVLNELDKLEKDKIPTRNSFFSEILCLMYPSLYPIKNTPVNTFIDRNNLSLQNNLSEGEKYIELAKILRHEVKINDDVEIKNLLDLDLLILIAYSN